MDDAWRARASLASTTAAVLLAAAYMSFVNRNVCCRQHGHIIQRIDTLQKKQGLCYDALFKCHVHAPRRCNGSRLMNQRSFRILRSILLRNTRAGCPPKTSTFPPLSLYYIDIPFSFFILVVQCIAGKSTHLEVKWARNVSEIINLDSVQPFILLIKTGYTATIKLIHRILNIIA